MDPTPALLIALVLIQALLCGAAYLIWVALEALHAKPDPPPCQFEPAVPLPCDFQCTDLTPLQREMAELQVLLNQMRARPAPGTPLEPRDVTQRRVEQALAGMGARLLQKRLEIRAAKAAAEATTTLKTGAPR